MKDKKTLGFWMGIVSALIVIAQVLCKVVFNVEFEVNMIVDVVSLTLAVLVMFGVLNSNIKTNNIKQIKEQIEKNLKEEIEEVSTKEDCNKKQE